MKKDIDVPGLFVGLTRTQAERMRECTVAILPALRQAVVEATKEVKAQGGVADSATTTNQTEVKTIDKEL